MDRVSGDAEPLGGEVSQAARSEMSPELAPAELGDDLCLDQTAVHF
ncbi:MAG TPA: hypothetical protein VEL28_13255 [Candidatus Binatia bacterium]|nr:hypothetical protein [Candidatus Binatia bacterium]